MLFFNLNLVHYYTMVKAYEKVCLEGVIFAINIIVNL
jgi:hypothetical protein